VLLSGIVALAGQLDYESVSRYQLVIAVHEATDGQWLLSTSQLTIDVINVNDHAPQFSHNRHRVFLSEDSDVRSFVIQLVATDADSCHGNVTATCLQYRVAQNWHHFPPDSGSEMIWKIG